MAKVKKTVIIEMDEAMVRVLYAMDGAKGRYIADCDILERSDLKDNDIIRFIRQVQAKHSLQPAVTEVIAVIPRNLASFRYYRFPSHNPDEIQKMAELQLTQFAPYADNDMIVHCVVLKKEAAGYAQVMAVVVPKSAVERVAHILQEAHFGHGVITLSSWGLFNWARYQDLVPLKEVGAVAIVTLEEKASEVCLCSAGEFQFSREIREGYRDWETGAGLKGYLRQIKLTLDAYQREKFAQPLVRIVLVSAMPDPQPLAEEWRQAYGVSVTVIDPLNKVLAKKDLLWPQAVVRDQTILASAAGFVLAKDRTMINLVPQDFNARQQHRVTRKRVLRIAVWAVAAVVLAGVILQMRIQQKRGQIAMLKGQLEASRLEANSLQKKADQVNAMKSWLSGRVYVVELVDQLSGQMPEEMELKSLVLQGNRLVIQGSAPVASQVNTLQQRMVDSAAFSAVSLDYVNRRKIGEREEVFFKITANIEGATP